MDATLAVDWTGPIEDALSGVARFVPKFVMFLVILLVGWLIARLIRSGVDKLLERVGFDRAVERGGVGRALARTRYDASDLVAKLVYYAILLLTLQLAFGIWGANPVSDLIEAIVAWLPRAIVAIVIVVVASAIAGAAKDLIGGALGGLSYGRLLAGLAATFILGLGIIAALDQIGVATAITGPVLIAVLATIAGILIVGVGGGLVRPMQQRWETWLSRAEAEAPEVSQRLRSAAEARRQAAPTPEEPEAGYPDEPMTYEGQRLADAPTMIVPLARPPAGAQSPAAPPARSAPSIPSVPATPLAPSGRAEGSAEGSAGSPDARSAPRLADEQTSVIPSLQRDTPPSTESRSGSPSPSPSPSGSRAEEFTSPFSSPFADTASSGPPTEALTDPTASAVTEPGAGAAVTERSGAALTEPSASAVTEPGAGAAAPSRPRKAAKRTARKPSTTGTTGGADTDPVGGPGDRDNA